MGDHNLRLDVDVADRGAKAALDRLRDQTEKTMKEIDGMQANPKLDADAAGFRTEVKYVREEMKRIDKKRATAVINADVDGVAKAAAEIEALEQKAEHAARRYTLRFNTNRGEMDKAGALLGIITRQFGKGQKSAEGFAEGLANAGIRLGPLTLRLKSLLPLLAVMSPMVTAVVGSLAGMTASIGSGLLGVLAGATTGLGAFGLGLGGIAAIAIPLTKQMGALFKAQKAYNDAVRQHGSTSKQALAQMEKMDQVTGHIGKENVKAVLSIRSLGSEWVKLTRGARPDFFKTIAEGVRTARADMPLFARESVQSFHVASQAAQGWLKGLRGAEAQGIFKRLFDTFQKSFPNITAGFGSLFTMFGRIADAGRGMWERFSEGFSNVTKSWADFFKPGKRTDDIFGTIEHSASSLFKLLGASGKLIGSFFLAGAKSGDGMLKTITDLFNKWSAWLNTVHGQKSLQTWMDHSWETMKKMVTVVGQVIGVFSRLSSTLAPIANMFLGMAVGIGKVVSFLSKLPLAGELVKAFFALWAANKILAVAGAISKVVTESKALAAVNAAAGALGVGGGGGGFAILPGKARAAKQAEKAAAEAARAEASMAKGVALGGASGTAAAEVGGLGKALAGAARVMTGFAGAAAATVGTVLLVAAAVDKLTTKNTPMIRGLRENYVESRKLQSASTAAANASAQLGLNVQQGALSVKDAAKALAATTRGTGAHRAAVLNLRQARLTQMQTEDSWHQLQAKTLKADRAAIQGRLDVVTGLREAGAGQRQMNAATLAYETAVNRQIRNVVNLKRGYQGLAPIIGEAGLKLGRFIKEAGPKGPQVQQFFVKANVKQAEEAIKLLQRAQRLGQIDAAIRIISNAKSVEDGIRSLDSMLDRVGHKRARPTVTVNGAAALSTIDAVQAGIAGVHDKSVTLTVRQQKLNVGTGPQHGSGANRPLPGGKPGAWTGGRWPDAMSGWANAIGAKIAGFSRGGRADKPTFVVGEENKPEYIIATNPAYRRRNLGLLADAAAALGLEGFKAGGIVGRSKGGGRRLTAKLHDKEDRISDLQKRTEQKERALDMVELNPFTEKENPDGSTSIVKDQGVFNTVSKAWDEIIAMKTKIMRDTGKLVASIGQAMTTIKERLGMLAAAEPSKTTGTGKKKKDNPKHATWERVMEEWHGASADVNGMWPEWKNAPTDAFLDLAEAQKLKAAILGGTNPAAAAGGTGGSTGSTGATAETDPNKDAMLAQANLRAQIAETSNAINSSFLGVFRGPGDIASGALGAYAAGSGAAVLGSSDQGAQRSTYDTQAGSGGATVIINTLHPGDPATLRAIGDAATSGMSMQGSVVSPSFKSGY